MKVRLNLKDGTKKKFNHVRCISARKDTDELWLLRYIYKNNFVRIQREEIFKYSEKVIGGGE